MTNTVNKSELEWDVFVTPGLPIVTLDKPSDVKQTFFQATAVTLIYGAKDAVLVDTFMTARQTKDLADWIASKDRDLKTIYITHGHGDHWFGVATLLGRFPEAKVVATRDAIEVMKLNASPKMLDGAWKPGFPGQIPEKLVIAEELKGNVIELEGQVLQVIELGHTDTKATTCLYVPSIGLVVAGDSVYNSVHLYLAESTTESRGEWIAALDKIESLRPTNVVASHKMPENQDEPGNVAATRQYIKDFDRLLRTTSTAQEFYAKMLELHPGRINRGWALWGSIRAFKS